MQNIMDWTNKCFQHWHATTTNKKLEPKEIKKLEYRRTKLSIPR